MLKVPRVIRKPNLMKSQCMKVFFTGHYVDFWGRASRHGCPSSHDLSICKGDMALCGRAGLTFPRASLSCFSDAACLVFASRTILWASYSRENKKQWKTHLYTKQQHSPNGTVIYKFPPRPGEVLQKITQNLSFLKKDVPVRAEAHDHENNMMQFFTSGDG